MRATATAVLMLVLLLAGCTAPGTETTVSVENLHPGPRHADGSLDCGDSVLVSYSLAVREGNITMTILDGAGDEVLAQTFEAPDSGSMEQGFYADGGTWRVLLDAEVFVGRFDVTLTCPA